jgi:hypothetical protein
VSRASCEGCELISETCSEMGGFAVRDFLMYSRCTSRCCKPRGRNYGTRPRVTLEIVTFLRLGTSLLAQYEKTQWSPNCQEHPTLRGLRSAAVELAAQLSCYGAAACWCWCWLLQVQLRGSVGHVLRLSLHSDSIEGCPTLVFR